MIGDLSLPLIINMTTGILNKLSSRLSRTLLLLLAGLALAFAWARWWPLPELFQAPRSTVLLDRNGELLGASVAADGQWRFPPSGAVPERFATCLIQFEDRHFHDHSGIHIPSLVRAFLQNRRAGRVVSGGSTLTMQVARLGRGRPGRTYFNKFLEAWLAIRIDLQLEKEEILRLYCANAPFGGNVVGLEAAAWRYYGRPAERLSWSECATLAVLPNAPSIIYPGKGQDALRDKRNRLLDRLFAIGILDSLDRSLARQEALPQRALPLPQRAPHLLATLKASGHSGRIIRSTLDGRLQDLANLAAERYAPQLRANEVHNAAILILSVDSGKVLAYVGNLPSAGPDHAGQVDLVRAQRSTGSLLKPFLFADMLGAGELLPDMLVSDVPTRIDGFNPRNYDEAYSGAVPACEALSRSLNVPAVRALRSHGVDRTLRTLRAMGLTSIDRSADHYGLSLIIGGSESTLWELCGAYASMARIQRHYGREGVAYRAGDVHAPVVDASEVLAKGGTAEDMSPLSAASIHFTLKALREVKRPDAEAGWEVFADRQGVAWKTGTSVGHRDAWAIGVTNETCIGVWTGNANGEGRPGLTGTLAAAPLLFDLFGRMPRSSPLDPPFDELVRAPLCRWSGHRAGPDCPVVDSLFIPIPGLRTLSCPYHRSILVDGAERFQVRPGEGGHSVAWAVLPPAMEHYYALRDPSYRPLPTYANGSGTEDMPMQVLYPESGARLLIPLELDGTRGKAIAEVAHRRVGTFIDWDLDGTYLGRTTGDHRFALSPTDGPHVLTLTDAQGHVLHHRITVVGAARDRHSQP
jgi:penicillin-binding protein 1C